MKYSGWIIFVQPNLPVFEHTNMIFYTFENFNAKVLVNINNHCAVSQPMPIVKEVFSQDKDDDAQKSDK